VTDILLKVIALIPNFFLHKTNRDAWHIDTTKHDFEVEKLNVRRKKLSLEKQLIVFQCVNLAA